jgi:hypothetical protein
MVEAPSDAERAAALRRIVQTEMHRTGVTYADLAERLKAYGLEETEASIATKLAHDTFAVTFFTAVVAALRPTRSGRKNVLF